MKSAKGMRFKNINLMATDPNKEQFAPTAAQPIRQRARMAGDPLGGYPEAEASAGDKFRSKVQEANKDVRTKTDRELQADNSSASKAERIKRINDPVR